MAKDLKTAIKRDPKSRAEAESERIGEFLKRVNELSSVEVRNILRIQKKMPCKRFGEIALEKGYIYDEATKRYLSRKGFI